MTANSKQNILNDMIETLLEPTPFELVLLEFKKSGPDWTLRIFIDHPEGVTIDHCETVTRLISDKLDEEDPIEQAYNLEVSSPGVDRPLTKPKDFERFINERVEIKMHGPVDGRKHFTGTLLAFEDGVLTVHNEDDETSYQLSHADVAKASLKPILKF